MKYTPLVLLVALLIVSMWVSSVQTTAQVGPELTATNTIAHPTSGTPTPQPTITLTPTVPPTPEWMTVTVHAEGYIRLAHYNGPGIPNRIVYLSLSAYWSASAVTDQDGFYSITADYRMPYRYQETFRVYPSPSRVYSFEPRGYWGTCPPQCTIGGVFVAHPQFQWFLPLLTVQTGVAVEGP